VGLCFFWSAALFRRFLLLDFVEKTKKSGGKAPHSKKRQSASVETVYRAG